MTDLQTIARQLSEAQRDCIRGWKFKGWVQIRADILPAVSTGLLDIQRFPMRADGIRKARLNKHSLALRAYLMENPK